MKVLVNPLPEAVNSKSYSGWPLRMRSSIVNLFMKYTPPLNAYANEVAENDLEVYRLPPEVTFTSGEVPINKPPCPVRNIPTTGPTPTEYLIPAMGHKVVQEPISPSYDDVPLKSFTNSSSSGLETYEKLPITERLGIKGISTCAPAENPVVAPPACVEDVDAKSPVGMARPPWIPNLTFGTCAGERELDNTMNRRRTMDPDRNRFAFITDSL